MIGPTDSPRPGPTARGRGRRDSKLPPFPLALRPENRIRIGACS